MSSNDYHIKDGELQPGLGADEPDDEMKEAMKTRGMSTVLRMRKQVEEAKAGLSVKEQALLAKEQELALAHAKQEAREKDLKKREAELLAKTGAK